MDALQVFVNAIGWTLIHSLWLGALAAAAYALPATRLRNHAPQTAYAWGLACLLGLVLALTAAFAHELAAVRSSADAAAIAAAYAALPVASSGVDALAPALTEAPVGHLIEPLLPLLVLLWALAVLAIGGGLLRSQLALRRLVTAGVCMPALAAPIVDLARHFGVSRPIAVVSSAVARAPFVIGHFAPVIVLPLTIATGMPWPQLKLILAHEIAHLRRADYLVNWLQIALEVLLFFHPGVRWLSEEMRRLREACCDDMVVAYAGGRADYTRALLALEEYRHEAPLLAPSAVAGGLLWRVQRIAGRAPSDRGSWQKVVLPAVFLGLAVTMVGGGLQIQPGSGPRDLVLPRADLFATSQRGTVAALPRESWQLSLPALDVARMTPPAPAPAPSRSAAIEPLLPERASIVPAQPLIPAQTISATTLPRPVLSPSAVLVPGALDIRPQKSVKPAFPKGALLTGDTLAIELEFKLDARGAVTDIHPVDAPADADAGAFITAARAALEQWQYAPSDAARLGADRLRHRFVFRDHGAIDGPDGCSMMTGTRICVVKGQTARDDQAAGEGRRCQATTGSRLCRR